MKNNKIKKLSLNKVKIIKVNNLNKITGGDGTTQINAVQETCGNPENGRTSGRRCGREHRQSTADGSQFPRDW